MNALFGFSGRMRRRSFALWIGATMLFLFLFGILAGITAVATQGEEIELTRGAPAAVLLTGFALITYIQTALAAKRLHDAGWTGWLAAILSLTMIVNLAAAFLALEGAAASSISGISYFLILGALIGMPPTDGDNAYGSDPRRSSFRLSASDIEQPKGSRADQAMDALIESRSGGRPSFGRR